MKHVTHQGCTSLLCGALIVLCCSASLQACDIMWSGCPSVLPSIQSFSIRTVKTKLYARVGAYCGLLNSGDIGWSSPPAWKYIFSFAFTHLFMWASLLSYTNWNHITNLQCQLKWILGFKNQSSIKNVGLHDIDLMRLTAVALARAVLLSSRGDKTCWHNGGSTSLDDGPSLCQRLLSALDK